MRLKNKGAFLFNRKIKIDGFLSAQLKSTRSLFQGWWAGIDI
ncbi:hypothetical protein D1BOALGB6SA_3731 [Olavius sp. associated proteobacterium Delta 1]|nr:hypothetical protein D1BOALGB6SA_3731 [Olavius sp. associated proteobacterium Delta 1]